MDLSDLIDRNAAFTPDKDAIRFPGQTLTYAELAKRIHSTAFALKTRLGVGRGDRVAILSLNRPDYLVLLYACARLGAMLVPINWRLATPEHLYILEHASVKALFVERAFEGVLEPLASALPECRQVGLDFTPDRGTDLAGLLDGADGDGRNPHIDTTCPLLIVYTSGTTGRPKGAVLRQDALVWNAIQSTHMHDMTSADHVFTSLPMFHVGGLNIQTTPALQAGATVTLHDRFEPTAALKAITEDRPTLTVLVPATMLAVLEHPDAATADFSSLRAVTTGSTIVPQPLVEAFHARGIPVLQVYGSTETAPICIYTRLGGADSIARRGTTGLPGLACEAKVVDAAGTELPPGTAGEIIVRGPTTLYEYWGDEAATSDVLRNGWFHTGDIATRDADGYFYVHDRKKNVIISGGENIYPAEVERVLHEHPAIVEAAVVGRPDPHWQEVPVAFLVARPGLAPSEDEIIAHLRAHLARFKVPREIRFVDDLPKNAMGKVQHFQIKADLAREREAADA
ncbi:class I adenylate-forming enzyme family protein [Amorphus orientalis]|uniref:3-methylmercaptopropionyl-CoA ligase n=1 Tax=Amorphus orientalis TaxID=649198 RepID=A0AAE3VSQ9_9HYPH|nr:long-chain-fatty-acid--CoA ligase [Amorphus orientalis]MDQ0317672.1 fatty-acyl-CoA synthase [Amorphus orientalis]